MDLGVSLPPPLIRGERHLTSPSLGLLVCKMGIILQLPGMGVNHGKRSYGAGHKQGLRQRLLLLLCRRGTPLQTELGTILKELGLIVIAGLS